MPVVNYLRAVTAFEKGELERAKTALLEVLQVDPGHLDSLMLLGSVHVTSEDYAAAEGPLNKVVASAPEHLPARKLLAVVHLMLRRPERAIDTLLPVLEEAAEDVQLQALLGSAYMSKGKYITGMEYLERATARAPDAAAIRAQLALSHLLTGSTGRAITELERVVNLDPGLLRADILLVISHLGQNQYDKALEVASTLTGKQPDNPIAWNLMGGVYEGLGDLRSSRQHYEKALEIDPAFSASALNLARLDLDTGDTKSARRRHEAILAITPHEPKALVGLANVANQEGHAQEVLSLLERARDYNRGAVQPRLMLTEAYQQQGRRHDALAVAEEAYELDPQNPAVIQTLATAQLSIGNPETAVAILLSLVDLFPQTTAAHYQLGIAQSRVGATEKARLSFERALSLNGDHLGSKLALGQLALQSADIETAVAMHKRIEREHPGEPEEGALRGDTLMTRGKFNEAASAYAETLANFPRSALVIALFQAYWRAGEEQQAEHTLGEWLERHPTDSAVRVIAAEVAQRQGRDDIAVARYEQVLSQNEYNLTALNNLAWLLQKKDLPRALELAKRAYEQAPGKAGILDTYGWLLVQSGRANQGLVMLDRAVELAPEALVNRYHRAVELTQTGSPVEARQDLMQVLESDQAFEDRAAAKRLLETLP